MSSRNSKNPLSDQELDTFFKHQLEHNAIPPSEDNWTSIRRKTTLSAVFRSLRSSKLSYVAAVALLLLTAVQFSNFNNSTPPQIASHQTPHITPIGSADISTCEQKENTFVMDISSTSEIFEDEQIIRKEIIDKEIDAYLAFLLSDDEFENAIDSAGVAHGLAKADQLPIDELFTEIPELPKAKVYTILTPLAKRITLPHRFVESEKAVEDYLAHYEKNQRKLIQY